MDSPLDPTKPSPNPGGHRGSGHTVVALAAIVATALVIAAVALLVPRPGHDDERSGVAHAPPPPRPFGATVLPPGFRVTAAGHSDAGEMAERAATMSAPLRIWGPSSDRPGLGVSVLPGTPGERARYFGRELRVRGHRVFYAEGTTFGRHSLVVANKDHLVYYVSPTLDRSELISVAERARVSGVHVDLDDSALPHGWRLVGEDRMSSLYPVNAPAGGQISAFSGRGSVVTYGSGAAFAAVASGAGDLARLNEIRLMLVDEEDTQVRGHPAIAGTFAPKHQDPAPVMRLLTWEERPGELIRVTSYGLRAKELRRIATGIRPLTDAEFQPVVGLTAAGLLDDGLPLVGTGRFTSREQWVLRGHVATKGGALEIKAALVSSAGGATSRTPGVTTRSGPFMSVSSTLGRSSILAYGLLRPDVASVALIVDGHRVPGVKEVSGFGSKGWVAEVHPGAKRAEVIAFDASGRELGQAPLDIPPHPPPR